MSAILESALSPARHAQACAEDARQAEALRLHRANFAHIGEVRTGVISAAATQAHASLHATLAQAFAHYPTGPALLAALEADARAFALRQCGRPDAAVERAQLAALLRAQVLRLFQRAEQKDRDLREAVQALQDRARDAFDVRGDMSQDALEAAWEAEAPEDFAQFKRLWFGVHL